MGSGWGATRRKVICLRDIEARPCQFTRHICKHHGNDQAARVTYSKTLVAVATTTSGAAMKTTAAIGKSVHPEHEAKILIEVHTTLKPLTSNHPAEVLKRKALKPAPANPEGWMWGRVQGLKVLGHSSFWPPARKGKLFECQEARSAASSFRCLAHYLPDSPISPPKPEHRAWGFPFCRVCLG